MTNLEHWYRELPPPATLAGRYALGVAVTAVILALYHALAQPSHPYLIGLFPVIATAILVGAGPALVSLVITSYYIDTVITPPPNDGHLFIVYYFLEGLLVLWMVRQRQHARHLLSANLAQREQELAKLRNMHDQLITDSGRHAKSLEQLRESNQIMVKTLERILDKPRNG